MDSGSTIFVRPIRHRSQQQAVAHLSKNEKHILHDALSSQMQLLSRASLPAPAFGQSFRISTGRTSELVIIAEKPYCTCSTFARSHICKHLLFVYIRILHQPSHAPHIFQQALLVNELQEILNGVVPLIDRDSSVSATQATASPQNTPPVATLPRVPTARAVVLSALGPRSAAAVRVVSSATSTSESPAPAATATTETGRAAQHPGAHRRAAAVTVAQQRLSAEETCAVCYGQLLSDRELVWCQLGCGRSVHADCYRRWCDAKRNPNSPCVLCRAEWQQQAPYAPERALPPSARLQPSRTTVSPAPERRPHSRRAFAADRHEQSFERRYDVWLTPVPVPQSRHTDRDSDLDDDAVEEYTRAALRRARHHGRWEF